MLLLILAAQILLHPLYASQRNSSKADLDQLRSHIQALQDNLASKEAAKTEAADALRESESAISHTNRRLAKLIREKNEANTSLNQLNARSKQITINIEKTRQQLGNLLYQQYLNGSKDYLQPLLNQQDPNQIARDLYYLKQLTHARSESIDELRTHLDELEILTQISDKKRQEIATNETEQTKQQNWLEREKTKRKDLLSQISVQIAVQRNEIEKLKRDEERLATLAKKIDKLVTNKNTTLLYNHRLPDASKDGRPFVSLKGHLNLPVRGELVNRFGSPRSGNNITWKGLFIRSENGGDVKAIAGGQVVFADWLRGFGNLTIIDHGNNYMSLYGNNETLYKQVGDIVRGGDTVATVGNSGGNSDSGLYFELRHQGKPFDPLTWTKIE
ncbi:MAG: peptidoglycan DD-metalloendopeptidase family protein [Nitrosomonas sp.]|nr:peptidoglycan DD-metalloendopeptidase family protein [Nitrosomonas sp.]